MLGACEFQGPGGCDSSMTPSQQSVMDDSDDKEEYEPEPDSDYESDSGRDSFDNNGNPLHVRWIGPGRTVPIVVFDTETFFRGDPNLKQVGVENNLACKVAGDSQILREILLAHGFHEVDMTSRHYNIAWSGRHARANYMRKMADCHVINHFPKTEQLTRKDKLYHNIQIMQRKKGKKHFDFIPLSFVLPDKYRSFCSHFQKEKSFYIVKPVSMSRGRGVYLIDDPKESKKTYAETTKSENETRCKNIVCKYISNPLIIDGYKFDLRIYVAVTSFDPIVVYIYNEGLTRFATVKYDLQMHDLNERCMHLTNYSINVESEDYIMNTDPEEENSGSKWSMGALLRYFKTVGIDSNAIMRQIEDIVIKTIICVEWKIAAACRRFVKRPHNCFELFGFDILLDESLKAWLLEVNLSPSLGCDTPLDIKIKTNMLCDLLNLVGVRCYNSHLQNVGRSRMKSACSKLISRLQKSYGHHYYSVIRDAIQQAHGLSSSRKRLRAMLELEKNMEMNATKMTESEKCRVTNLVATLSPEEVEIIRRVREEESRRGGWVRIFPTANSWDNYKCFLEFPTTNNLMLHQRLYPARHSVMTAGRSPQAGTVAPSESIKELFLQMTGRKWNSHQKKPKDDDFDNRHLEVRTGDSHQREHQVFEAESGDARISDAYVEELLRFKEYEAPLRKVPPPNFRRKSDSSLDACGSILDGTAPCSSNKLTALNSELIGIKTDDVINLLEQGCILSKEQAKTVFSTYLLQILKKLMLGFKEIQTQEETDSLLGVVNLVTCFLKHAVQYLPKPFEVTIVNDALTLQERKSIVAQLFAEFIYQYMEDVKKAASERENCNDKKQPSNSLRLDKRIFDQLVFSADEEELEALLQACTKYHDLIPTFVGKLGGCNNVSSELCSQDAGKNSRTVT